MLLVIILSILFLFLQEGAKVLGTVQSVQYRKVDKDAADSMLPDVGEDGLFTCPCCKSFTSSAPGGIQEHMLGDVSFSQLILFVNQC